MKVLKSYCFHKRVNIQKSYRNQNEEIRKKRIIYQQNVLNILFVHRIWLVLFQVSGFRLEFKLRLNVSLR